MASAVLACVAGAKGEGEGGGRKSQKRGKGNPLLFSLPPFPSTLSTPATQAIAVQNRIYDRLQPCVSEMSSRKVRRKVGNFKLKLIKIQASAIIVNRRAAVIKPVVQQGDVGNTQYRNTVRKIGKCWNIVSKIGETRYRVHDRSRLLKVVSHAFIHYQSTSANTKKREKTSNWLVGRSRKMPYQFHPRDSIID